MRGADLRALNSVLVGEGSVRDALAGLTVSSLLAVAADGGAKAHSYAGIFLQPLQGDVVAGVFARLNQQLVQNGPYNRRCTTNQSGC